MRTRGFPFFRRVFAVDAALLALATNVLLLRRAFFPLDRLAR